MARVRSHVSAYNAAVLPAREQQAEPQKHTARIHRPTYTLSNAFQAYRYLRVSARAIFSHTRFSDFFVIIFFFFFFFFIFFFLSHRPSALRKRGKRLIFTPNISTGDGGVHRHQAIVPFLLYDRTTKSRDPQLHITERRHFTTTTPFRIRAMCQYIALITPVQGWEFGAMAPKIAPDSFIERQVHKPSASKRKCSFANPAVRRLRAKN